MEHIMTTGQLAVPLHHVEGVGDIAVLSPHAPFRCDCGGSTNQRIGHVTTCGIFKPTAPVVGQVVAHVENCARCLGNGKVIVPWSRDPIRPPSLTDCGACGGSGWVRDQYVRVTEVLPITDSNSDCPADGSRHIQCEIGGLTFFCGGRNDGMFEYVDLPGAVPGGIALIVEPAPVILPFGQNKPVPVPAPPAPYTEEST